MARAKLTAAQRAERAALAGRMKGARFQTVVRLQREITQDEMAVLVGKELGRPFHATQWRRYETGKSQPALEVILAAAHISGLPECELAFGKPGPNEGASTTGEEEATSAPSINWERAPLIPAESLQAMPRRPRRQVMKKRKRG
jgi:transcriptional regulator with XRE-family HTH domain